MQLKDTLEIEETLGGFQATLEDQFLLNDLDSYPGDTSRFFTGIPADNLSEIPLDETIDLVESEDSLSIPSYQSDISLEDEFDLSSIPTGKPSDFGYDDGRPSSSPFNEDAGDAAMFEVGGIDDFIHSADQNPTPIVDNSPAVEPIRIQLDEPIFEDEPVQKAVKPPKIKKPSKPLDRKVVIVFTMLVSSMMVTMFILFLLWKNKQDKEALYVMKATQLHHTSPNGQNKLQDSLQHGITHQNAHSNVASNDSSDLHSKMNDSLHHDAKQSIVQKDTVSKIIHSTTPSKNIESNDKHSNAHSFTHSKQLNAKVASKKSNVVPYKDSENSTSNSNNRSMVTSKMSKTPEYALKVHSSYSKIDAISKAEQLRREGIENVTVTEQKIRDRTIYNVRYGKFSSFNEAESASRKTALPSRWIDRTK